MCHNIMSIVILTSITQKITIVFTCIVGIF